MVDLAVIDSKLVQWLDDHEGEMVAAAQSLIRIPSTEGQAAPGAPFGAETRRALDNVLQIGCRYGLGTKMFDGYAAHLEIGAGDEIVGVLSHVDVVPAGSDWTRDPWGAEIDGGRIYGRGAIDDKGPTIAALYAILALKATGAPLTRRIRHIVGADEESGFECMHHYFHVAHEPMPVAGFTPDGRFPVIYAEKGIATPTIEGEMPSGGPVVVKRLSAGERANMVPDRAVLTLGGDAGALARVRQAVAGRDGIEWADDDDQSIIRAVGVSAHASTPQEGVNAVAVLAGALRDAPDLGPARATLALLHAWATDTTGAVLGIAGSDDVAGPLTSNLGVVEIAEGRLRAVFSVRHPVTWTEADVRARIEESVGPAGLRLADWHYQAPLYVPADSPLVRTLLEVYRAETGDMQPPKTMGGGTYARVLDNGVAFGPNFPGFPENAHQADEFWTIDDMRRAARIYVKALARLAC